LHWRQDSNEPRKPVERLETQRGADTSGSVVISVQVALDESKAAALASALSKPGLDQGGLRAAVFTGWEIGFHTEVYQPGGKARFDSVDPRDDRRGAAVFRPTPSAVRRGGKSTAPAMRSGAVWLLKANAKRELTNGP
jgi:hypothetical protein